MVKEFGEHPGPVILRDGTSVLTFPAKGKPDPYVIDYHNGTLGIFYKGEFLEEADFCPVPEFYGKKTSSGMEMDRVGMFRPQRLDIWAYRYCHYWEGGNQCKFCSIYYISNTTSVQNNFFEKTYYIKSRSFITTKLE